MFVYYFFFTLGYLKSHFRLRARLFTAIKNNNSSPICISFLCMKKVYACVLNSLPVCKNLAYYDDSDSILAVWRFAFNRRLRGRLMNFEFGLK